MFLLQVITYSVSQVQYQNFFYMDNNVLTLSESLENEVITCYRIVIEAKDNAEAGHQLSSYAVVNVYVVDPATPVEFNVLADTVFSFPENTAVGSLLFSVADDQFTTGMLKIIKDFSFSEACCLITFDNFHR